MESQTVRVAAPSEIHANPENPRLIFREKDLFDLEQSIADNGILVPLTVFKRADGRFVLLDGERRWRCATKLNLHRVPIIVQPEPTLLQNIMMMFAIHNARTDWDPLPTALKLRQLEKLYEETEGVAPTESQLAQLASLNRGEVRRLKSILALPKEYLDLIQDEQDLPRSKQTITVDHLLEVTRGAGALSRERVIDEEERQALERALIAKFRDHKLTSTVEPRLLTRLARAVQRGGIELEVARSIALRLTDDLNYTIRDAYDTSVKRGEEEHNLELLAGRLATNVSQLAMEQSLSESSRTALLALRQVIDSILGS